MTTIFSGMSVRLGCERDALDAWWHGIAAGDAHGVMEVHPTVCELLK